MLKIEIIKSKKQYYFRMVAGNNRILCHSETYLRKQSVLNAIKVIERGFRNETPGFRIVDKTIPQSRRKP